MTRTLSPQLGAVVERLELEQPQIVTLSTLTDLVHSLGIRTQPRLVALRLRERGWLLEIGMQGVWEFAPGAHAGPFGHGDPLGRLKAATSRDHGLGLQLALSTAAWASGYADRVPHTPEVTLGEDAPVPAGLGRVARVLRFVPHLEPVEVKGLPAHRPETILAHMATRPRDVRSWTSSEEWLSDVAADAQVDPVLTEMAGRPAAARVRLGYLLQRLRPDIADAMRPAVGQKAWFGPRGPLLRHSAPWQVADTVLPFDPAALPAADETSPDTVGTGTEDSAAAVRAGS